MTVSWRSAFRISGNDSFMEVSISIPVNTVTISIDTVNIVRPAAPSPEYDLRRLQIKHCRRLGSRAVLALDCCLSITRNVHPQV